MAGKLGRIRPVKIEYVGRFKLLTLPNGRKKLVPRLAFHYDRAKDVQPPPDSIDYSAKAAQAIAQMYGNDTAGDCVIADTFHQFGLWTGNETGTPVIGTTQEALNAYQTICGPGDNGCVITDVLDYLKSTGVTIGGGVHKNDGYVSIDWTDQNMVKVCLEVFGSIRFGINLPQGWYNAPDGGLWDVVTGGDATVVGGHDVGGCAYYAVAVGTNALGVVIMTWGGKRTITWAALVKKPTSADDWGVEECYAQLAADWYNQGNLAPNGIDAATLMADLQAAGQGTVPPLPGPTPPSPPPPSPPPPPGPTPAPTATLTALPPTLPAGEGSTLQWSTTNATSAVLADSNGTVLSNDLNGMEPVGPFTVPGDYNYTLAVNGTGGSVTELTTVTVNPAPQPPPTPTPVGYGGTIKRHVREGHNLDIFAAQDTPAGSTYQITPPGSDTGVTALMTSIQQQITNLQADVDAQFANVISILVGTPPSPSPARPVGMSFSAVGVPGGNVVVTFTWQPQPPGDPAVVYSLQLLDPTGAPVAPAVQVPITQQTYTTPPMPDSTGTFTLVLTAITGDNPPLSTPSAPFSFVPHTAPPPPPPVPPAAPVVTAYTVANAPAQGRRTRGPAMSFEASPFDKWDANRGINRLRAVLHTTDAGAAGVWQQILAEIEALIASGAAKPVILAAINASPLPAWAKAALVIVVNGLMPGG